MLARTQGIRHACDLDLLLFFHRHPRAIHTSEQLVAYLGHDRERVAKSIEGLIHASLLTRLQNPAHAARLYILDRLGPAGGGLAAILKIGATHQGRQELLRLLEPGPGRAPVAGGRRGTPIARIA